MRIDSAADFERKVWPGPPAGHEGLRVDFKRQLDGQREAAIDVAAMANADGGTILYGVDEGPGPDGHMVAIGLSPIEVDATKAQLEAAIDEWLSTVEQRPEMFPIVTGGQTVLVVRIRPSARLVAVRADSKKHEGLVYVGRNNHGKYYMGADEVERRIQGYAARSVRLRLQEFLDTTHGAPIRLRVYHARRAKEATDTLIPPEWPGACSLVAAGEWAASVRLGHERNAAKHYAVEVPYELITLAWWQPTSGVEHPGRPAILVSAHLKKTPGSDEVIEVTPLLAF